MLLPPPVLRFSFFLAFGQIALILCFQSLAMAATQLTFNPATLLFGEVKVGSKETLAATIINHGSSSITVSAMTVTGADFDVRGLKLPLTLAPGQGVHFTVSFSPAVPGPDAGSIAFNGNAADLHLHGWGVSKISLTPSPASLVFGNVQAGSSKSLPITLTNRSNASMTVVGELAEGAGFAVHGLTLPLTLEAGHSVTFRITFSPKSVGSVSGIFKGLDSKSHTLVGIPLTGTGTPRGQLIISPPSIDFGKVTVGKSSRQTGTIIASWAPVTVSSATSSSSEFILSGISLPLTIATGRSASYSLTFTPRSSGTAAAKFSFVSNAWNSPTESLTGTGVAPPNYRVSLSWDASPSPVAGYNVYRGSKSGGPYSRINSTLDSGTTYTDKSVLAGHTYYYVTTAVNSRRKESAYSNPVKAVIP